VASEDATLTERPAEGFFRDSDYWRAWSEVPDLTADVLYAVRAVSRGDRRVLDVPCGRGRLLRALRHQAPDALLVGADVNAEMARQVDLVVTGARVLRASVYELPFRDASFDAVLCHQSLMHFDRPRDALAELARLTRDRLYFSVTTRRQLNTWLRRLKLMESSTVPHWTYDLEDIEALVPPNFQWHVIGAFLVGQKALRLSHAAHLRLHQALGRHVPQSLLRRFGQSLFLYGRRIAP
jgi:SAM-dependent methyltransferase